MFSLKAASRELGGIDRRYLRGLIHGLGIELEPIGTTTALSEDDLERLRQEIDRRRLAVSLSSS